MIELVWTTEWLRFGVAAYAEDNNRDLLSIEVQLTQYMNDAGTDFYVLERQGVFLGYAITLYDILLSSYIRPQFKTDPIINSEIKQLLATLKPSNVIP